MTSIVGMTFGDLKILNEDKKIDKNGWNQSIVYVKCECGNERWLRKTEVITGIYKNCKRGVHGKNVRDLREKIFGYWTILSYSGNMKWLCRCICGIEKTVKSTELCNGFSKSCGCKLREILSKHNLLPNNRSQKNRIFRTYKKHAKNRNLDFKLTFEEFTSLTQKPCFYCKTPLSNMLKEELKFGGSIKYEYNGVDRINSSIGYIKKNCVSCCKICNASKSDLIIDEWISWVEKINKNLKEIKDEIKFNTDD